MGEFKCDFCGSSVSRVRRVALDGDYDRLSHRHAVRYACEACSRDKESRRKKGSGPVDAPAPSV